MVNQASSCDLKDLVQKFIPEVIGKEIEKATTGIYPLQNVFIRKVKILKAPKFDLGKLMEVYFSCLFYSFIFLSQYCNRRISNCTIKHAHLKCWSANVLMGRSFSCCSCAGSW